ncbi:DUF2723 domain-containing protein [bacterium]|nr:DUF2723 domain-containing protein [bacterium]
MQEPGQATPRLWVSPTIVGLASFALYAFTAARDPQFGDGLELLAAAAVGGIPHPTGYPLLELLLAPLAHGDGAYFRGALLCALFAAITAAMITALAGRLIRDFGGDEKSRWIAPACGAIAAASASLWSSATIIEVYSLNAVFLTALLLVLAPNPNEPLCPRRLALAGLLQGLALTNHLSSLCMAPLLAWRILQAIQRRHRPAMSIVLPAVGGVIGLLVYLYVPLRAASHPPINWGNPQNWSGFRWLVGGGDYRDVWFLSARQGVRFTAGQYIAFAGGRALEVIATFGSQLLGGIGDYRLTTLMISSPRASASAGMVLRAALAILIGGGLWFVAGLGAASMARRSRALTIALCGPLFLQLIFIFTYNIPDIADYYLGLLIALVPYLAVGAFVSMRWIGRRFRYEEDPGLYRRLHIFAALLVLIAVLSNWRVADHSGDDLAARWIDRLIEAVPENAVLITHGDADIYGAWYAKYVLGERPDLFVAGANFLRNEWYASMLPKNDPLGRQAIVEPGEFKQFRLEDQVALVARGLIEPNLGKAPIVTTDADPLVIQGLAEKYRVRTIAVLISEEEALALQTERRAMPPTVLLQVGE